MVTRWQIANAARFQFWPKSARRGPFLLAIEAAQHESESFRAAGNESHRNPPVLPDEMARGVFDVLVTDRRLSGHMEYARLDIGIEDQRAAEIGGRAGPGPQQVGWGGADLDPGGRAVLVVQLLA